MEILNRRAIDEFATKHANARRPLQAWVEMVEGANWQAPADIKAVSRTADFLSGNRVVFNIKGNDYRLVVEVAFSHGSVDVLRVGTHSEYTKWRLE